MLKLIIESFAKLEENIEKYVETIFENLNTEEQVSIIDGMQRTTALFETLALPKFDKDKKIRIECGLLNLQIASFIVCLF